MKQLLNIDGRFPGLNEMTNANRTNKFAGSKQKKKYNTTLEDFEIMPVEEI